MSWVFGSLFSSDDKTPTAKKRRESNNQPLVASQPIRPPPVHKELNQFQQNKTNVNLIDRAERKADEIIARAVALNRDHKLKEAVEQYQQALELLIHTMKTEKRHSEKQRLRVKVAHHMTKAEQMKSNLPSQPARVNVPAELRNSIESEILDSGTGVTFDDVVGLQDVKQALKEMVILPLLRPDLFHGLRQPPKGLLMYGPPGNGKTFVAKAVARESKATFFSISASSLVSSHMGVGEKLVKALFAIARERAPSIIFIDEIDSMLSRRSEKEHEASRRLKTEFLIQLDGVMGASEQGARVLVIGATNTPESLDDAVIRRMPKRIYVGPPEPLARKAMLLKLLKNMRHNLTKKDVARIVRELAGYSGSDIKAVCQEASMGPIRDIPSATLMNTPATELPPIRWAHFAHAMTAIRPSVSSEQLVTYREWADNHA